MAADKLSSLVEAENIESVTPEVMSALIEALAGSNRRKRQEVGHVIALVAEQNVSLVQPYVDELIDALYRPEAQTRWEALGALGEIALVDADAVEEAYDGAEASLFDEDSAIVRLAAFRFLVRLGASSSEHSDKVWSLLDEAIQCYHGDPEYRDMLMALAEFAKGSISETTRAALLERIGFDAKNGYGYVRVISSDIVAAAQEG